MTTVSLIDQFAAKRAARLAGVQRIQSSVAQSAAAAQLPATAGAGAGVPASVGQHPPAFAPCSRPSGVPDLFGDGSPTICGSRHLWIDGYGNVRCCVCQQPPSMVMVRRMVWLDGSGAAVDVRGGDENHNESAGVSGAGTNDGEHQTVDGPSDPRVAPLFIGDPNAKFRIKAQQQPGEAFDDWWSRSAETTDFLFDVIQRKSDGTLPGAKKIFEIPDKTPKGEEEWYLVRVRGGSSGAGDGGEDAGGSLKTVNAKAATRYKSKVAMTFTGARKWWYLREAEEGELELANAKADDKGKSQAAERSPAE